MNAHQRRVARRRAVRLSVEPIRILHIRLTRRDPDYLALLDETRAALGAALGIPAARTWVEETQGGARG